MLFYVKEEHILLRGLFLCGKLLGNFLLEDHLFGLVSIIALVNKLLLCDNRLGSLFGSSRYVLVYGILRNFLAFHGNHRLACGDHLLVGRLGIGIITLGIAHFGNLDGLLDHACGRLLHGSGNLCRGGSLFGNGLLGDRLLGFGRRGIRFHGLVLLARGSIIIQLPKEVGIGRDHAFVLLGKLGGVIGSQLEGGSRLFLANIFLDQLALHQCLGGFEGILLCIIDRFNVNGREPLLLAGALNQLHSPLELTGRAKLVLEGGLGVFLLIAHVSATVDGSVQTLGLKRQIELQNIGLNVDLCDLCASVMEAVRGPADAALGSLVGKQSVLELTVIFLDTGTRLDQLCLKALAIVRHNVASRILVKTDDALVSCKAVLTVGLFVVNVILVVTRSTVRLVELILILGILLVEKRLILGSKLLLGEGCQRILLGAVGKIGFLALLQLVVQKIGQLFHELLCGGSLRGRLYGNLANDLLLGLGHDFFHDLIRLIALGRGRILQSHGSNGGFLGNAVLYTVLIKLLADGRLLIEALIRILKDGKCILGVLLCLGIRLLTLLLCLGGNKLRNGLGNRLPRLSFRFGKRCDILGGNKEISLFLRYDQKHRKNHGTNRYQSGNDRKCQIGHLRNGSQRNHGNGIMIVLRGFVFPKLLLLPTRAGHLSRKDQDAGNFYPQQAGKHGNGNEKSASG